MHISARAKVTAIGAEDHHIDIIGIDQIAELFALLCGACEVQRCLAGRPW